MVAEDQIQDFDVAIDSGRAAKAVSEALVRASMRIGIKGCDLARVIGTSPASVSRMRSGEHVILLESKTCELALLFLRVYFRIRDILGNDGERMRCWMHSHHSGLGGVPADMIRNVRGLNRVLAFIEAHSSE